MDEETSACQTCTSRQADQLCHAESGLEGLKKLPRTGRPPQVSGQNFAEIKKSENLAGWRAKEVMNIIYEKTCVRYHEVHIYRLLHK